MEITVNQIPVHYLDEGDPKAPAVLLLHGWGVDGSVYHLITDHLSAYCRVIVPDLPGFGKTPEPAVPYRPDDYADFVLAFLQALGIDNVICIGHSNGGRVLLHLLSRPDLPITVRKAVLIDSAGLPAHHSLTYYIKVYSFKTVKALFSLPLLRDLFPNAVENARKKRGSADYQAASPLMRQSMVIALNTDATPLLSKIRTSVLLIWGKDDTATPLADGKKMEQRIPDAGLATLSGGHWAFAEQFGQCSRILDAFLKQE